MIAVSNDRNTTTRGACIRSLSARHSSPLPGGESRTRYDHDFPDKHKETCTRGGLRLARPSHHPGKMGLRRCRNGLAVALEVRVRKAKPMKPYKGFSIERTIHGSTFVYFIDGHGFTSTALSIAKAKARIDRLQEAMKREPSP